MTKNQVIECLEQLDKSNHLREDFLSIRDYVKETQDLKSVYERHTLIAGCIRNEDPKVRRLSIELLGMMGCQEYLQEILTVYLEEETLFVKADYLKAMEKLDYKPVVNELKKQHEKLKSSQVEDSLKVHVNAELKQLYKMIVQMEGMKEHHFNGLSEEMEVLLTTKKGLEDVTFRQLTGVKKKRVPGGVMVKTDKVDAFRQIRTYEEILFYFGAVELEEDNEAQLGKEILKLGIVEFLKSCHKESHAMGLRIQYNGKKDAEKKGALIRKLGPYIEEQTEGWLFNTTTGYEVELRIREVAEKKYQVLLKLFTLKDHRFEYRKETLPVSIKPYLAANLVQLAAPFLKEGAQILDPYCGVGTMLIERRMAVHGKDTYGIDQYGEAINKARINSEKVGPMIHYVQRNFEDFSHNYLFDEIITNMPTTTRKVNRNAVAECYGHLFSQGRELLKEGGVMVIYGNEHGIMKRLLRMNKEYTLLRDFEVDAKLESHLYVIGYKTR